MAWSYANWQTATSISAVTGASVAGSTFTISGYKVGLLKPGDLIEVDVGANVGTYRSVRCSYAPDVTTVHVSPAPASGVAFGGLLIGPSASTRAHFLRLHIAEVSAEIQSAVSADGVSHNSQNLQAYLQTLLDEQRRHDRSAKGFFVGALV